MDVDDAVEVIVTLLTGGVKTACVSASITKGRTILPSVTVLVVNLVSLVVKSTVSTSAETVDESN